jgi:hypothetical protein
VRTITQADFEAAILHDSADGPSNLANIVVHPKVGPQGYWVTGSWTHAIRVHEDPSNHRSRLVAAQMTLPVKFLAPEPYHAINPKLADAKTVFAALDAAGKLAGLRQAQSSAYRYAWQEQPILAGALWIAGSMALIGGIWPAVLGFLVGAGFGPVNEDSGFGELSRRETDQLMKKSLARMDELLESIAEYEAEMGLRDEAPAPTPDVAVAAAAPAVRQLSAGPLEQSSPAPAEADKDFGGEFYPTEIHHDAPVGAPAPTPRA